MWTWRQWHSHQCSAACVGSLQVLEYSQISLDGTDVSVTVTASVFFHSNVFCGMVEILLIVFSSVSFCMLWWVVFQCRESKGSVVWANPGSPSEKNAYRKPSAGLAFLAVFAHVLWLSGRFCHASLHGFAGSVQLVYTEQKLWVAYDVVESILCSLQCFRGVLVGDKDEHWRWTIWRCTAAMQYELWEPGSEGALREQCICWPWS